MLKFFNDCYYSICEFYAKRKEDEPGITGLIIIALMHALNIASLLMIFGWIGHTKAYFTKTSWVILYAAFLVLDGIYFNKYNYAVLKETWANEDQRTKRRKQAWVTIYVFLSFVTFFTLAIYLGSKKW